MTDEEIGRRAREIIASGHLAPLLRIGRQVWAAVDMDGCELATASCEVSAEIIVLLVNAFRAEQAQQARPWWRRLFGRK